MDFKRISKGGGLFLVSAVVVAVTWLVQSTNGALRIIILAVGLVTVFMLFSFLLSRQAPE